MDSDPFQKHLKVDEDIVFSADEKIAEFDNNVALNFSDKKPKE
jgi:hypothetical protein